MVSGLERDLANALLVGELLQVIQTVTPNLGGELLCEREQTHMMPA